MPMTLSLPAPPGQRPIRPPRWRRASCNRLLGPDSSAASGVVYGDIGTSPLYAFREADRRRHRGGEVNTGRGVRRAVADLLGSHRRRHAEVRGDPACAPITTARGYAHPDGTRSTRAARRRRCCSARHDRRHRSMATRCMTPALSVLVGRGRPQGRDTGVRASYRGSADCGDPHRAVRRAIAREPHRSLAFFGPITPGVVHRDPAIAGYQIAAMPSVLVRTQPCACRQLPRQPRHHRSRRLSAQFSCGDRRGSASTPISAISAADPIQFAWLVVVLPALVLRHLGQGASRPRRTRRRSRTRSSSIRTGHRRRWWFSRPPRQ